MRLWDTSAVHLWVYRDAQKEVSIHPRGEAKSSRRANGKRRAAAVERHPTAIT
jgi:hypothetical protein